MHRSGKNSSRKNGSGCLVLFSLPFAAFGVGMAIWNYVTVIKYREMRSWAEVPATIKRAELKVDHDSDGGTTYEALADYEYDFQGRHFSGHRVSIHSGSDNVGSFHQDAYGELKAHQDQQKPFHCYVNQARPADAVLYRQLRGEMLLFKTLFSCAFGSVGLALFSGAIVASRRSPRLSLDGSSDQPWKMRPDWGAGFVEARGGARVIWPVLATVTLFWLFACLPVAITFPDLFSQSRGIWRWLLFVPPAIAALLVWLTLYQFLRRRKFGDSIFQIAGETGVIGGQLAGIVRIPRFIESIDGFHLKLVCFEERTEGDGKSEIAIWQDEHHVSRTIRGNMLNEAAVPVLFAIPFEAAETAGPTAAKPIRWRLSVWASVPGIDFHSQFDVPVFKTADSRPDFKLDEKLAAEFDVKPDVATILRDARIIKEDLADGGVRLIFPMAQDRTSALIVTGALAIFGIALWPIAAANAPPWFRVPFLSIWTLLVLALAFGTLDYWFYRSVIDASPREVAIQGGLFGLGRRRFQPQEIENFESATFGASSFSAPVNIVAKLKTGKQVTVAKRVSNYTTIQTVLGELNSAVSKECKVATERSVASLK
jgi:hypothetical protein